MSEKQNKPGCSLGCLGICIILIAVISVATGNLANPNLLDNNVILITSIAAIGIGLALVAISIFRIYKLLKKHEALPDPVSMFFWWLMWP